MSLPTDTVRSLRRTLFVYRVVLAVSIGALLLGLYARRARPPPSLTVLDLGAKIDEAARTRADEADTVEWFFRTPDATLHLHALGAHQICPLHIHRQSHEATLILSGAADVSHVYGPGGNSERLTHARPGMLIDSPPLCGHAWKNAGEDGLEANLVFESPPFDGNLYLDEGDRWRAAGPAPEIHDLVAELEDFARSSEPSRSTPLPLPGKRLSAFFVRSEGTLDPDAGGTLAIYVVAGTGTLEARGHETTRLAPKILVLLSGPAKLAVHAETPTALLLFRL